MQFPSLQRVLVLVALLSALVSGCEVDAEAPDGGVEDSGQPPSDAALDGGLGDASVVDATVSDATVGDATVTDAAVVDATAADGGAEDPGGGCLPSPLSGTWTGDAHASLGCGPFVFEEVEITGDLIIDDEVTIHFQGHTRVGGDLRAGDGARLLCVFGSPTYGPYLSVTGSSEIQGTSSAPVVFTRDPISGFNNACHVHLGAATVDYAHFGSTPPVFGGGSTVRDSVFDTSGNGGDRLWVRVSPGVLFEYNRFALTQIRGIGFTARYNHFDGVGYRTSVEICHLCGDGADACTGTRSEDPAVVMTANVFDTDPDDSVFQIGRRFGAVDLAGNHFPNGRPTSTRTWSGTNAGCSGDALGTYGGPLTLSPVAFVPPPVFGPRP